MRTQIFSQMNYRILFSLMLLSLFSCSEESPFQEPSESNPISAWSMAQHESFSTYMELVSEISNNKVDEKKLSSALEDKDHEAIAIHSGYSSLEDAMEVSSRLAGIILELNENFPILEMSSIDRDVFFGDAFDIYVNETPIAKSDCGIDRTTCLNTAVKDFAVAAGGCGVATAGATLGGPIVAGFTAIVCLGTATYVLEFDRRNCNLEFQKCINKPIK